MRFVPAALLLTIAACSGDAGGPKLPPDLKPDTDPFVVGLLVDSITPASRLYQSPWWALYIVVVGADAAHSGIAYQGTTGRDEANRLGRCLGPAGQLPGERQLAYVALGDTLYAADSLAYWTLVNRLGQGADSLRIVLDSALAGSLRERLPGLVVLTTGLFDPTVSAYGRGATPETAILRRWLWTDAGRSFAEDTTRAALTVCGLR